MEIVQREELKTKAKTLSNNLILYGDSIPVYKTHESALEIAKKIIRDYCRLSLSKDSIHNAHRIGKPPTNGQIDQRRIKLYVTNSEIKNNIIRAYLTLRDTRHELYINEELLPYVAKLYYDLRMLKKSNPNKIFTLYTRNGIIHVKKTRESKMMEIVTKDDFIKFINLIGLDNQIY